MTARVKWVPYGPPAQQALLAVLRQAKGDEPLAPVSVIVPSNYVGVSTRRLLGSGTVGPVCRRGSGLAAVSFLTVYRLAELLGSARLAGSGRRPVSTPVIAAALRTALAERPGIFAPVADHGATETALVAAYQELRDLSDEALDALGRRSARAADVVALHRIARHRLKDAWYDEEDLIDSAVAVLGSDERTRRHLGAVVVFLPERLTRHGGGLLAAVADGGTLHVLAGTTGASEADADVVVSVGRITAAAAEPTPDGATVPWPVSTSRTRIVTVPDCDEEVRVAVRAVVEAAREGTPLDRMAVLCGSAEPYGRLVHEHLAAAGIAANGAAVTPLGARLAGRTLLHMLALPGTGFRREDVMAWLAGTRLRHEGSPVPVTAWERLSRAAGVVAGRHHFDRRLEDFAVEAEAEAAQAEADPDAPSWLGERRRADAGRARQLRAFVLAVADDLERAAARPRPWSERAAWAQRHLTDLLGGDRRRGSWPRAERTGAERVERALRRLACLDAVEPAVSLETFVRTLEIELEADLGRVGRMGEGVLVGSLSMGAGLDLDLVVVLGLAEGLVPSPVHEDSLLPDTEREATAGELPRRAQRVGTQRRQLLASLAGSSRQLLCIPRGDLRRNIERVPSRFVLDLASHLAGERWWSPELLGAETDWLVHVASFDAGLRTADYPATAQEHRLRRLMAEQGISAAASADDAALGRAVDVVRARASRHFTRFDGNLAGLDIPSPAERPTSATRLEGWATCPFAYLLREVLGVEEVENPEDQLEITPKDRGSLVHEALERFIAEVLDRPPADQPGPDDPWTTTDRHRLFEIAEELGRDYENHGLTGRAVFWHRDRRRILLDLDRFVADDSTHRAERRLRPVAAELAFGLAGASLDTVALALPDGRAVHFRGKADRVDVSEDGTIEVVDYKTGSSSAYRALSEDDPDAGGRRLQLVVYGEAARRLRADASSPVRAEYWFVSARGKFDRVGYAVTPAVVATVSQTLGTVVAGIEAGVFPAFPTATSTATRVECPYCDPDGLGVADLQRRLETKAEDGALALFLGLARPDDADG